MTTTRMITLLRAESKRHEAMARLEAEYPLNEGKYRDDHLEVSCALRKAADMIADMTIFKPGGRKHGR